MDAGILKDKPMTCPNTGLHNGRHMPVRVLPPSFHPHGDDYVIECGGGTYGACGWFIIVDGKTGDVVRERKPAVGSGEG